MEIRESEGAGAVVVERGGCLTEDGADGLERHSQHHSTRVVQTTAPHLHTTSTQASGPFFLLVVVWGVVCDLLLDEFDGGLTGLAGPRHVHDAASTHNSTITSRISNDKHCRMIACST